MGSPYPSKTVTGSSLVSTVLPLTVMVHRAGKAGNTSRYHSFYPWPGCNRKHYLTWRKATALLRLASPLALCASRTKVQAGRALGDPQKLAEHPQVAVLSADPLTKVL